MRDHRSHSEFHKKLTSVIVLVVFSVTGSLRIGISKENTYRVSFYANRASANERSHGGLPFAFRPYRGKSSVIRRSQVAGRSQQIKTTHLNKLVAMVEKKIDWDLIQGRMNTVNSVSAVNVEEDNILSRKKGRMERNVYSSRRHLSETSPVGSTSVDEVSENINTGREAENFEKKYGKKKGGARAGITYSRKGISGNNALIRYNNRRRRLRESDSRRGAVNYRPTYFRQMDYSGAEENEENSFDTTLSNLNQGQENALSSASSRTNKSNSAAGESSSMYFAAIAMFLTGIALINGGHHGAGYAAIAAGIMMMMKAREKGADNKAGDWSGMAGAIYDDGLDSNYNVSEYVKERLSYRDRAVKNYRTVRGSGKKYYKTYKRGDSRNRISVYRSAHAGSFARANRLSGSRRGRSSISSTRRER